MILPPAIAEKVVILANTSDALLPGFSPLERAAIIALKAMIRNEKDTGIAVPANGEYRAGTLCSVTTHSK